MTEGAKKSTPSLSAVDWVEAALRVLAEEGLESVHVTKIAARLSVTKGSFYWHFRDRRALLDAMFERWANDRTAEMVAVATQGIDDPRTRIETLGRLAREVAPVDRAMRMWATKDEAAARAVQQADRQAFAHVVEAVKALGFDEPSAKLRARILLLMAVGGYSIDPTLGRESGERGIKSELALILGR